MLSIAVLVGCVAAQQPGVHEEEYHPQMPLWTCSSSGCIKQMKSVALDANWRWLHNGQYTNCYKDGDFNQELCPDPVSCARNCHLEGNSQEQYGSTYGIKETEDGIKMDFVTTTKYGSNFGSRVYMMDTPDRYRIFKLKNREFTLTVDMFYMPCGLNGAVYFVEMDADGGQAAAEKTGGANRAGAKYGTGYCDAQCPHDLKFMEGKANVIGWNASHDPPIGKHGACCAEMDIWEANSRATAYTPHPCSITGTYICEGIDCGDNSKDERYQGVCDKDGCDFNSWRLGDQKFYGRGARDFKVDSRKKVTVVTQFITEGNRDDGDLIDIRRFYVQDGKVIPNSNVSIAGVRGDSITDKVCSDMKEAFGDVDDFNLKGGLKTMGEALDRGMVLVMSLWDDAEANMLWLDADYPTSRSPTVPGVNRGPCNQDTGRPSFLRAKFPDARVKYSSHCPPSVSLRFSVAAMATMASVNDIMKAINQSCRAKGGHYAGYSCQVVSWDDVCRGEVDGALSCWGANITDTYLKSKSGANLFTVRSDNWNERLGVVSSSDVAVVAAKEAGPLQPVTLRNLLQQLGEFGSYAGLAENSDLSNADLDAKCSIRFQTTFIPVQGDDGDALGKLEFATEAYNYNTMDDSDPRNLVLLCTSQGVAVQQDGSGAKKLFHHAVDDQGHIHRYWLEAEESKHKVGGEQRETEEERAEAQARGKATSSVIGIRAMGQRFNVLMTIQVPLQQKKPARMDMCWGAECEEEEGCCEDSDDDWDMMDMCGAMERSMKCRERRSAVGTCTAARVSRGSEYDVWPGLSVQAPERHGSEHVTLTVVMYNTVKGGVPSAEDVAAAVDDLEALYQSCSENGFLADDLMNFMKEELKVADMTSIAAKLSFQPPAPVVVNHDVFPS